MYILSFYEGSTELSLAFGSKLFKFPYTYSENLFLNSFSQEEFYRDVIELGTKELDVKLELCEIYVTGLFSSPKIPFEVKKSSSLLTHLPDGYIYVDSKTVATKEKCNSFMPLTVYETEDNLLANLTLYNNLVYTDTRDVNTRDSLIRAIIANADMKLTNPDIVLSGDRFVNFDLNKPLSYLLVMDILRQPGIFYVRVDKNNMLPHVLMLDIEEDYSSLGTLINSPGKTECLYKTDVGTSQMIDLEANKLFIVPLEKSASATVVLKNSSGHVEQTIKGGELGLVIDTRNKADQFEFKEVEVDAIIQALNRI